MKTNLGFYLIEKKKLKSKKCKNCQKTMKLICECNAEKKVFWCANCGTICEASYKLNTNQMKYENIFDWNYIAPIKMKMNKLPGSKNLPPVPPLQN